MSAVSAMMEGMDNLLFELDRTVQRWKCGRPHIDRPQRPGLGGGRKHRASVKLRGELDRRFSYIAEI
jgi:hypothetical protein